MVRRKKNSHIFPLVALVLAWIVPGAGHVYIGRPIRGAIIFVTITAMFWAGVAMGGVMTVDKVNERWWFIADMFTGVHGLIAWRNSDRVFKKMDAHLDKDPDYQERLRTLPRNRNGAVSPAALLALKQQFYSKLLSDKLFFNNVLALVPPTETIARAYAGVAGLMNLLCIFDALLLALMVAPAESLAKRKDAQTVPVESEGE